MSESELFYGPMKELELSPMIVYIILALRKLCGFVYRLPDDFQLSVNSSPHRVILF
jgi:hypothetical protein